MRQICTGLISLFNRATLNVLKTDFCSILSGFHQEGRLNKEINATFLALVDLREFRPISLVGSPYKLLSKVLANRLKIDLPFIIGPFEGAFVKNSQILDGVLKENGRINSRRRSKNGDSFQNLCGMELCGLHA